MSYGLQSKFLFRIIQVNSLESRAKWHRSVRPFVFTHRYILARCTAARGLEDAALALFRILTLKRCSDGVLCRFFLLQILSPGLKRQLRLILNFRVGPTWRLPLDDSWANQQKAIFYLKTERRLSIRKSVRRQHLGHVFKAKLLLSRSWLVLLLAGLLFTLQLFILAPGQLYFGSS